MSLRQWVDFNSVLKIQYFNMFQFLTLCACILLSQAFYLPWLAPVTYCRKGKSDSCKSTIPVYVNRLNSIKTVIPYEYNRFDFCTVNESHSPVENLGQVVFGERIRPSPYMVEFLEDNKCKIVCEKEYKPEDAEKLNFLKRAISLNYQHDWILDNMPLTWCYEVQSGGKYCSIGFPIGCYVTKEGRKKDSCTMNVDFNQPDTFYLFNHVDILVSYHSGAQEDWGQSFGNEDGRIISIKVIPRSIDNKGLPVDKACVQTKALGIPGGNLKDNIKFNYTYSVFWLEHNDIKWASRWDYILESMPHTKIQWFSIINSLMIVLFMSGMVAVIMLRTRHKDIARYNQMDSSDNAQTQFGWKLVHGYVFRPPRKGMLLAVLNGSGIQIFFMTMITLACGCLGFLSPANRGALMTCVLVMYVFQGASAGYISARIYKTFGGEKWKSNVIFNAFLCPGIVFAIVFILNVVLRIEGSSEAIPFTTSLLALWFGVSVPLTLIGSYFGFKKRPIEHPVKTSQIPRQIPNQPLYRRTLPGIIMGVLPYSCIFIQLLFILNSIWFHQIYYEFGFLMLVLITCSEVTILLCYLHLCAEKQFGWMLVHGDVFRPPRKGMLLAVLNGSGIQIIFMTMITLACGCLGFLSPANRGALMTCILIMYVSQGASAGYISARIYKTFGGEKWKSNVILTAFLCPGIVFAMFFILNLVLWIEGSSAAIPFTTLIALLALWFGISVPLTFIGAYFGFKKRPIDHPVKTSQIPRQIPNQPLYRRPLPRIIIGGLVPFGCIYIQLFIILGRIWFHQIYYMFGFLMLVFLILLITSSEVTILLCYFHLCAEDYNWWWRSFLTSGFTAVYLFIYCIYYYISYLELQGGASTFLYFGYMLIVAFLFFLLTGTIGFLSCYLFVITIYRVENWRMDSMDKGLQDDRKDKGLQDDRMDKGLQDDKMDKGLQNDRMDKGLQDDCMLYTDEK